MASMESNQQPNRAPRYTRRQVLRLFGGMTLACAGVGAYAWGLEPEWLRVVERSLPIANLPASLEGARLVQLSDLHAGPRVPQDYLAACMRRANALAPDLTVITGDFIHYTGEQDLQSALELMELLEPGRLGAWAVLGNHDYGPDWGNMRLADRLTAGLAERGVRVLRNDLALVEGLLLAGIDDYWGPRFAPELVVPRVDWSGPALTLCHNPDSADTECMAAVRGWILAGHTHGGQVKLPLMDPFIVPSLNPRYTLGEIDLGGGRWMYINCGLGYGVRLRLGVRPEITLFHLQRA
ncbi:MAG: metallophosphoesterase [Anaerolineae bacterium]